MPSTSRGITLIQNIDSTRLWEHFQTIANDVNTAMDKMLLAVANLAGRPAHIAGRMIFQSDVKTPYVSDGTAWDQILTWATASGLLKTGSGTYAGHTSNPATGTALQIQGGTWVGALSSGETTITFPHAFPNGLLAVIPVPGDTAGTLGFVAGRSQTLSNFVARCFQAGGTQLTTQTVRIDWIAIGW